jgi:hypothetical protein
LEGASRGLAEGGRARAALGERIHRVEQEVPRKADRSGPVVTYHHCHRQHHPPQHHHYHHHHAQLFFREAVAEVLGLVRAMEGGLRTKGEAAAISELGDRVETHQRDVRAWEVRRHRAP